MECSGTKCGAARKGMAVGLAITLEREGFAVRRNTLYGVLQRGWWCITAFGRTPVCLNIPWMVQNRTGFEVAREEEEAQGGWRRKERTELRKKKAGKAVGGM